MKLKLRDLLWTTPTVRLNQMSFTRLIIVRDLVQRDIKWIMTQEIEQIMYNIY